MSSERGEIKGEGRASFPVGELPLLLPVQAYGLSRAINVWFNLQD